MDDTLMPADWPTCWHFALRGDVTGDARQPDRIELGEATTRDHHGALTYHCKCGATMTRQVGDLVQEARNWVARHAGHMAVPT